MRDSVRSSSRSPKLAVLGVTASLLFAAFGCGSPPPQDSDEDEAEPERLDPRGPGPSFQTALWPGEGRPLLVASDTLLLLRSSPSDTSRASDRLTPTRGAEVPFGETVYRTVRPGALLVLREHTLTGRSFGPVTAIARDTYYSGEIPRDEWTLAPGDTLALLQHRAEGSCFVRIDDSVVEADPCPTVFPDAVRLLSEPVTEWWVRVDTPEGPSGWARVGDGVRETDRVF